MRVDLPKELKPGEQYSFSIKWWQNINNRKTMGGHSGYEYFPEDGNNLYTIAQFYPRMCVYWILMAGNINNFQVEQNLL